MRTMDERGTAALAAFLSEVAQAVGVDPAALLARSQAISTIGAPTSPNSTGTLPQRPLGPPSDWLDDRPRACPLCHDARFVRRDVDIHHADFGKAFPCPECAAPDLARKHRAQRIAQSGLPAALLRQTLDTFQRRPGTIAACDAVQEFVSVLHTGGDPLWLALYGVPGAGKTHLLAALAQMVLARQAAFWATAPEWLAACQADGFALDARLTTAAEQAPVLVLDEVGSQGDGTWAREKLERVLNHRYAARLPTALGLTAKKSEIAAWSPRLADRLRDRSLVVEVLLDCPSYRGQLQRGA